MAPTKFQIYVDQSMRQGTTSVQPPVAPTVNQIEPVIGTASTATRPATSDPSTKLGPAARYCFDERRIYPSTGGEFSFEEINYDCWVKRQRTLAEKRRVEAIQRENQDLRKEIESLHQKINQLLNAQMLQAQSQPQKAMNPSVQGRLSHVGPPSPPTNNRLSIVPQSLQPTHGLEYNDVSYFGAVLGDMWTNTCIPFAGDVCKNTMPISSDKFTVPIDQSQYIKDNVPTSTPDPKRCPSSGENDAKRQLNARRLSRPSMGGSPTLKLSPITETSRDCNSKSSSSSSAMSGTPGTVKKTLQPLMDPPSSEEPDRPLDPNDPTTYKSLLRGIPEPLSGRAGFYRLNRCLPKIRQGACFQAGSDSYLVDKELSKESKTFSAQLLTDDTNDSNDMPIKTVCFRVDQPANEWLYYVCNELHRRLVKQKAKPDIELSVMIAYPAIMYNDGSILVDEYFRFLTLQNFFEACQKTKRPFPKSMAAYITLELIQLVRQIHNHDMLHLNIHPRNVLVTCCPTREDIANVDERTSVVKLIGFDRAMDMRLVPTGFKFDAQMPDLLTCEMLDRKPWTVEADWYGVLNCIHNMFFQEDMTPIKEQGKWTIDREFKGFPTNAWSMLFEGLLNISDSQHANSVVEQATEELNTWIKANISFVLKEADALDRILEEC